MEIISPQKNISKKINPIIINIFTPLSGEAYQFNRIYDLFRK